MKSRADAVKERILELAQDTHKNQRAGITEAIVDALCEELDSMERTLLEEIHAVPPSFRKGLNDCTSGRTVDMEIALTEKPPAIEDTP